MLRYFRALLDTWVARVFFIVLVGAFALWGVRDVGRNFGQDNALATVGDRKVDVAEFQDAFRRDMAQITRMMGNGAQPTAAIRKAVAAQTLDRLVLQASIADEVAHLGLVVPDDVLRRTVFETPSFRGPAGSFDRSTFDRVMRDNGLTEARYLENTRANLLQQQLLASVEAGVATPDILLKQLYALQHETREGEMVELPLSAAAEPATASDDDLQREYENNPATYSAPEYRRIKLVVLSQQTVARGIEVSDEDVKAYYEQHKAEYQSEEQRAAEVIATSDETVAKDLAASWQAGGTWSDIQKAATEKGATALALDDSTRQQFPSPELATAVFLAAPEMVTGPIKGAFGFQLFRVTKVTPAVSRSLADVAAGVKTKIAEERALDVVYTRANKLDDALSAGTTLDDLPGDLGLVAVTGTLDAQGKTTEGEPAPLPGSPELRNVIIAAAFAATKTDPVRMTEGPGQAYYALQLEDVIPSAVKPFADVRDQVDDEWAEAQRRHEQETKASKLMTAAAAGGSLDDAATIAGLRMEKTPPVTRNGAVEHVPPEVQQTLFRLKQGETTMVQTADGFVVVRLTGVTDPDPALDPAGAAALRQTLTENLDQDMAIVFATALRNRAQPRINRAVLDGLVE